MERGVKMKIKMWQILFISACIFLGIGMVLKLGMGSGLGTFGALLLAGALLWQICSVFD